MNDLMPLSPALRELSLRESLGRLLLRELARLGVTKKVYTNKKR
jgi:hypothetical protein